MAVRNLSDGSVMELQDALEIRALLLRIDGTCYLIGPFVSSSFDERRARLAIIEGGLPASSLPSIRLYYSAFPKASRQNAFHTVQAVAHSLCPDAGEFSYQTFSDASRAQEKPARAYDTQYDYETVYKRYELENNFLKMIEMGDTEHVLDAFAKMEISDVNTNRYINAIYFRPEIGFATIRTLSRKAAERGGATIMEINEITQRAVQSFSGSSSFQASGRMLHNMVLELTEAVRRHREEDGRYSPSIQKVVSYLRLNISQSITLDRLAKIAAMSPPYLSQQFKHETGHTISQTIQKLRCDQAVRLLKETDLPIGDISSYVGYPDSNYFVKVFKKERGVTPSAYRKGED